MTSTEAQRPTMVDCMDQLTGHDELEIEKRYGAIIELLQGAKYMRALAFSQELHAGLDAGKAYKKISDLTQLQIADYFSAPAGDGDDSKDGDGDGDRDDDQDSAADPPEPDPGGRAGGSGLADSPVL